MSNLKNTNENNHTDSTTGHELDRKNLNLEDVIGYVTGQLSKLKKLQNALDGFCPVDDDPGPYWFIRSIFSFGGIIICLFVILIIILLRGGNLNEVPGFISNFWNIGWIFIFLTLCVLSSMISHSKQRTYCLCFVRGIWWIAMFALSIWFFGIFL